MTTVLEYLRQGFTVLERIPKDDFDKLRDRIRLYRTNPQSLTPEELQELVSLTSHYYGMTGDKLAQIYAIKCSIERQLERRRVQVSRDSGVSLSKKAELDRACMTDDQSVKLQTELDETKAIELYFTHIREHLYMAHYALRRETETPSSATQQSRYKIHHGG